MRVVDESRMASKLVALLLISLPLGASCTKAKVEGDARASVGRILSQGIGNPREAPGVEVTLARPVSHYGITGDLKLFTKLRPLASESHSPGIQETTESTKSDGRRVLTIRPVEDGDYVLDVFVGREAGRDADHIEYVKARVQGQSLELKVRGTDRISTFEIDLDPVATKAAASLVSGLEIQTDQLIDR
jgi:hypothetical protein